MQSSMSKRKTTTKFERKSLNTVLLLGMKLTTLSKADKRHIKWKVLSFLSEKIIFRQLSALETSTT